MKAIISLALVLACLVGSTAYAQIPEGVWRHVVEMTTDESGPYAIGVYAKGKKFTNEIVIFDHEKGNKVLTAVIVYPHGGTVCNIEEADVTSSKPGHISASKTDDMFGTTCTLEIKVSGDTLHIQSQSAECSDFCGYGGRFDKAKLTKVCEKGNADIAAFSVGNMILRPDTEKPCDYVRSTNWD